MVVDDHEAQVAILERLIAEKDKRIAELEARNNALAEAHNDIDALEERLEVLRLLDKGE